MINETALKDFTDTVTIMVNYGFRFSVVHNPESRFLAIVSATNPDKIKSKMPRFNIYLSDKHQHEKIVDLYFYY